MNLGGQAALSTLSSFGRQKSPPFPPHNVLSESLGEIPSRASQVQSFFFRKWLAIGLMREAEMAKPNEKQKKTGKSRARIGVVVFTSSCAPFAFQHNNSCSRATNYKSFIQDYGFHTVPEWSRCEIEPIADNYVHRVEDANYDGVHGRLAALQKMA
jgi:hypothetical protein